MQDYQVNGAIMALQNAEPPLLIDLLEWQQPRDNADPYPNLHRPGLARLALRSSDLQSDYNYLVAQGVEVLSEPATVMSSETHGSSFFCFKDPDGTFLELVESF
jgi:catechol 2,3-dioxygenase-like lactoylglutathione lyase family enzyme